MFKHAHTTAKAFYLLLLAVVFPASLLAGCGSMALKEDGVLYAGNGAEVQNLDPHLVSGVTEHRVLSSLFEGLTDLDPESMQPVPAAADSWTVSSDGLVYTFHLRETGRWSNGDPVTAHDFVYAWKRILTPGLGAEYAYMLHCIRNAQAYNEGRLSDFSQLGIAAPDKHTLSLTLENPTPYLLAMQTHFTWFPVHQATVERHGAMDERINPWTLEGNHVGNGAFRLEAWRPNDYIRVTRNPHYWNAEKVRLAAIEYYPYSNEQTEERNFRAGALQLTSTVPSSKIPLYHMEQPDSIVVHPYCGVYFYRVNVTKPPMNDKRVRQAFALALRRKDLAENVLKGGEAPARNLTPPNTAGYTFPEPLQENIQRARQLLSEAGYPDGIGMPPVEILYNTSEGHKLVAEAAQRMWKESLGAEVRLLNQDWKVYLDSMNHLDYGLARSAWIADFLDPINFLECFVSGGGNNRTGFASEQYDRLIASARAEPVPSKRMGVLMKAERLLMDEMPIIPIYFYTWKFLKSPEVQGLHPNLLGYIRWTDLSLANTETSP